MFNPGHPCSGRQRILSSFKYSIPEIHSFTRIRIDCEKRGTKREVHYNHRVINWYPNCTGQFSFFKAGIASPDDPEQLLIALEPEAASVYCREKKMRDFSNERGDASVSDVFARPGSRYLVIDIGGNDNMRSNEFVYIFIA